VGLSVVAVTRKFIRSLSICMPDLAGWMVVGQDNIWSELDRHDLPLLNDSPLMLLNAGEQ
jgi:hypothetical protein